MLSVAARIRPAAHSISVAADLTMIPNERGGPIRPPAHQASMPSETPRRKPGAGSVRRAGPLWPASASKGAPIPANA